MDRIDIKPVTVSRKSSQEEREITLMQIYRQVLERQPYHSERRTLKHLEQDFLKGKLGVRRFLKDFGCSEVYLNSFYHNASNYKFLDVCFKHFMGRAIANQDEMRMYADILLRDGVHKLIVSLLDSEEYRKVFGCFTVPYIRPLNYYASPEAFLESTIINSEMPGQRGWSLATLQWRQLGLECSSGVCRHPEADEQLEPLQSTSDVSIEELIQMLQTMPTSKAKEAIASLSKP